MTERSFQVLVVTIGVVMALDLTGAILVSIIGDRSPLVLGDIAKVGMGALAGAVVTTYMRRRDDAGPDAEGEE